MEKTDLGSRLSFWLVIVTWGLQSTSIHRRITCRSPGLFHAVCDTAQMLGFPEEY
jgi:hypothetical protein